MRTSLKYLRACCLRENNAGHLLGPDSYQALYVNDFFIPYECPYDKEFCPFYIHGN